MRYTLRLTAPEAMITAADAESRTLRGIAIPYGEFGATNFGKLRIRPGAIRIPANLRRVKLFSEHGRQTPTGYTSAAEDGPTELKLAFAVARTPDGDMALLEAQEGVRDGLSVELANVELENGTDVVAADLVGVAQVAIPAFPGAVLTASEASEETPIDPSPAVENPETSPAGDEDPEPSETDPADTTEENPAMTETTLEASLNPAPTRRREMTAVEFSATLAGIMRNATDAGQVNAALADITPASTGSDDAFMRPAWLGELWTPELDRRPFINAVGSKPLTSMRWEGWRWVTKPEVDRYAGNKAEIPTSPASIEPADGEAYRIAGGWDLDRVYVDFPNGFVEAFMAAAVQDYRRKSEAFLSTGHPGSVGPPALAPVVGLIDEATDVGGSDDLVDALADVVGALLGVGARVSFIMMASDVYADFIKLPADQVPWWLQRQGSVSLTGQSVDVADVTIGAEPSLPAGTVLAGDRDAVDFRETGPIKVQAINIPNGGIDLALFGYQGQLVHDAAGLVKTTVPPPLPLADAPAAE